MGTQLRTGFVRVLDPRKGEPSVTYPTGCSTGKHRYANEADAIEGLVRVRRERVLIADPRSHESHLYPCQRCDGWHLSSTPIRFEREFMPEIDRLNGEPVEMHLRRLQNRIKEQRSTILSLLAVGNGGTNREARKRIASLTMSLARVSELWQQECRNREALVARLEKVQRRRWFRRSSQ